MVAVVRVCFLTDYPITQRTSAALGDTNGVSPIFQAIGGNLLPSLVFLGHEEPPNMSANWLHSERYPDDTTQCLVPLLLLLLPDR